MYPVMNLGTCFFLLNIYLLLLAVWLSLFCAKESYAWAAEWAKKLEKHLFWNIPIRVFLEAYLAICMSVMIGLSDMDWQGENYNGSVFYSNIFTILLLLLMLAFPGFILGWYLSQVLQLNEPKFSNVYGEAYDGLWISRKHDKRYLAIVYQFWFCMRRLLFAFFCIAAQDEFSVQISFIFVISMVSLAYLVVYKPFEDPLVNRLELINEVTNFVLLYHVYAFSGALADPEHRY